MGNLTMRNPALLSESKTLPVLLTYQRCLLTLETEHTSPSVSLKSKWHKHEAWKMHPSARLPVLTALAKWSSQEDRCRAARLILFTVGRQRYVRRDSRATLPTHAVPRKGRTCHYRWVTQENNHLTPCRVFTVASQPLATQTKSICSSGSDHVGGMASRGGFHPGLAAKPAEVLRGKRSIHRGLHLQPLATKQEEERWAYCDIQQGYIDRICLEARRHIMGWHSLRLYSNLGRCNR